MHDKMAALQKETCIRCNDSTALLVHYIGIALTVALLRHSFVGIYIAIGNAIHEKLLSVQKMQLWLLNNTSWCKHQYLIIIALCMGEIKG